MARHNHYTNPADRGLRAGYRSGLEAKTAKFLVDKGIKPQYEVVKLKYVTPEKPHTYTADFLLPSGIVVETKGRFTREDRMKHLLIKAQHPLIDIRFLFTNSNTKISKRSSTSYADWCRKNGFLYADKIIPDAWLYEKDG